MNNNREAVRALNQNRAFAIARALLFVFLAVWYHVQTAIFVCPSINLCSSSTMHANERSH